MPCTVRMSSTSGSSAVLGHLEGIKYTLFLINLAIVGYKTGGER